MKKLLVLLAMVLAFTVTSVAAQYGSSSTSGQAEQSTTSKSKAKKSAGTSEQAATSETGKAKKESTVTGCLSKEPDASGNYTLTNGRYKKGVKVEPADKVKEHAGHEVQLKGEWKGTGKERSFEVASLKHISETCKAMASSGAAKGEKGKETSAKPPKS